MMVGNSVVRLIWARQQAAIIITKAAPTGPISFPPTRLPRTMASSKCVDRNEGRVAEGICARPVARPGRGGMPLDVRRVRLLLRREILWHHLQRAALLQNDRGHALSLPRARHEAV